MDDHPVGQLASAIMIGVVAIMVLSVLVGAATSGQIGNRASYDNQSVELSDGGYALEGALHENVTVEQSLGTSLEFTGSNDSYASGRVNFDTGDSWSVSTWAELDDSARTQRVAQVGGQLYIDYVNASTDEWRVIYYDSSSLNSYSTSVTASDSANWTNIQVVSDGSTLTIYEGNSASSSVALTDGNSVNTSFEAEHLDGRVEETRVYEEALNSTQRQQLVDRPTAPLGVTSHARVMYDSKKSSPTSIPVYLTGSSLTLSNASIVDGFAGETVTASDWSLSGDTITAADGSPIDGAAAVFVSYDATDMFAGLITTFSEYGATAFVLLGVGLITVAAGWVMDEFGSISGGGNR